MDTILLDRDFEMNTILLDSKDTGTFAGPLASSYSYIPELRNPLTEVWFAAMRSANRFFVLKGKTVLAAQSTKAGAMQYMAEGCVLVEVEPIAHTCVDNPTLPCPACTRAEGGQR